MYMVDSKHIDEEYENNSTPKAVLFMQAQLRNDIKDDKSGEPVRTTQFSVQSVEKIEVLVFEILILNYHYLIGKFIKRTTLWV